MDEQRMRRNKRGENAVNDVCVIHNVNVSNKYAFISRMNLIKNCQNQR